jgi:alkylation response protein AidB-like acyl-CoA dehydrogenase
MDLELTPEQEMLRKTARDFAEREIAPLAREFDRNEEFPWPIVEKMRGLGFLGATVSEEYGGMGLDTLSYCLIVEEVARADSAVRSIMSVQCSLVEYAIEKWGTDEQKATWLPRLASGEVISCFCLTEPGSGSDAGSLRARAVRDADGWVLSGSKMFITNGSVAGLAMVAAQTDPAKGAKGITMYLVPTDAPGFTATEIKGKVGLRAASTAEVVLQDVRVPADATLGEVGTGMKVALASLDGGRISLAAGCVGIAQAALDAALEYASNREQFGKPIASFQLIQDMLADMHVAVESARLLTWKAALAKDRGERPTLQAAVAKYAASEAAVQCANLALQIHGGYGYIDEYPVGKLMRDARVTTLFEGTSQVQKLVIGRHLTGISAFG